MCQADVALQTHTAAIVYSFRDSDPSVLFGVLARVEALLGSHILWYPLLRQPTPRLP